MGSQAKDGHWQGEQDAGAPAGSPGGADGADRCRVLIVDGQTLLREGLRALLESDEAIEVVGAVADGAEALRAAAAHAPDVVLLDLALDAMDGLAAIRELKRRLPSARVVVLTMQDSEQAVWAALQAGADGYVLKNASRTELVLALSMVRSGRRFISPLVSGQIVSRFLQQGRGPAAAQTEFDTLTLRERQVLKLVAEGRRNREIAQALFISVKTVEKHRSNLMHKLKLHNTAALTSLAIEKGLVSRGAEGAGAGG